MLCKKVILNAIVSGNMANLALIFLIFRDLNLKFVIDDVVSLYSPENPLNLSGRHKCDHFPGK